MNKKKVLLITSELYPNLNSNSAIAYQLAKTLQNEYNIDVTILGYQRKKVSKSKKDLPGIKTVELKGYNEYLHITGNYTNKLSRYCQLLCHPRGLRVWLKIMFTRNYRLMNIYTNAIKRYCRLHPVDCIIPVTAPFFGAYAALLAGVDAPIVLYKLDPVFHDMQHGFTNNESLSEKLQMQKKMSERASRIFVAKSMYDSFVEKFDVGEKTVATEFPNVVRQDLQGIPEELKESELIHCTFAGKLYDNLREPGYTVDLFEKLADKGIVFHILGRSCKSLDERKLPNNVIYHGNLESDTAMAFMQHSDILVNIGNSDNRYLPSKILTYISTGRPILNIVRCENCPTVPYINKYPYSLNLFETENLTDETVDSVAKFCIENKGKKTPFDTIENIYYDCTPDYIGKQLYNAINESINEKNFKG